MKNENLTIENKFTLALQNHQKNNLTVAEKLYKEVLETRPNHIEAICYLGTLFAQTKKINLAKPLFLQAVKINPNNPNINNNLGNIFFELGEKEKAIKYYEKVIQLKPNHGDVYYNLGILFNSLGKYQKAANYFQKTIQINPNNLKNYNMLGAILIELGEYEKAINCYEKAIKIEPNNINTINGLVDLFRSIQLSNLNENNNRDLKNLFLFLFKKNNINHDDIFNNAKKIIFIDENYNKIEHIINSEPFLLNNKMIQNLLKEEIFLLILQKSRIRDKFLEKLLTRIRKEIIISLENSKSNILKEYFDFIISFAAQSFLNEYVFFQSDEELNYIANLEKKIINKNKIDELEISILGCYIPLYKSKNISNNLLNYTSKNFLFNDMIEMQIKEPLKEKKISNSIKSLKKISDEVSKKVRDQYEENPYPRWRFTNKYESLNFLLKLNNDIEPNKIEFNDKFFNPKVLIAGCGTGKQVAKATSYQNASILAIDLSINSLSYAKRKIDVIGYKGLEFLQGDILHLKSLNKKFDVIECVGVLHHMNEPLAGLKVLVDLLEPHGFLKLGLYSEISRKHIIALREFIKKESFSSNKNDIRNFREKILNHNDDKLLQKVVHNYDFYSLSSTRDLIFHVQEHRYTIPEISKILKNFNLEFLGFTNYFIKKNYSEYFPNDKKNISLDNWNKFEINNPDTFIGMYQFWVRKIEKNGF